LSKYSLTTPFIVRYLQNHIKKWVESGDAIYIEPLEASFDSLVVRSHWISLSFDRKWEFSSTLNLVSDKDMGQKHEAYRKLKELECELDWRGFLRRDPYFKTYSQLLKLRSMISQVELNPKLIEDLNADSNMIKLVRDVRPDQVIVSLHSINESSMSFINSEEDYFKALASYYNNPLKISWNVTSFRCLHSGLSHKRNVVGIYDILDKISSHIRQVSMEFLNS